VRSKIQSDLNIDMATHNVKSKKYLWLKCLSKLYADTLGLLFAIIYFELLMMCIVLTYLAFNFNQLSWMTVVPVVIAAACAAFVMSSLFKQVTLTHLFAKEIIQKSMQTYKGNSHYHYLFWSGMTPLRVYVGSCFSLDRMEFLLFIWGEIVLKSIIDLMISF